VGPSLRWICTRIELSTNPLQQRIFVSCFSLCSNHHTHHSRYHSLDSHVMSVANGSSSSKTPVEDFKSEVVAATPSAEPGNPQPKVRKHRLGVDPSLIISDERSKRRRSPSPERENDDKHVVHDPKDPERAKQLGSQIYRKIMETKDSE